MFLSLPRFAHQIQRREEFDMAAFASREAWRLLHVFQNEEPSFPHFANSVPQHVESTA